MARAQHCLVEQGLWPRLSTKSSVLTFEQYDRIDPAEVQALKEQIEALNAAKAALESAQMQQNETVCRHLFSECVNAYM